MPDLIHLGTDLVFPSKKQGGFLMFTWRHFLWLAISAVLILSLVTAADRKKPALNQVLTKALIIALLSEIVKMVSVIDLVPSANGELLLPYLPMNHMPLHFCSIQILFILYCRFSLSFIPPPHFRAPGYDKSFLNSFPRAISARRGMISPS